MTVECCDGLEQLFAQAPVPLAAGITNEFEILSHVLREFSAMAGPFQGREQRRHVPGRRVGLGTHVIGEDTGQVVDQATTGDVGQPLDQIQFEGTRQRSQIASVHGQQGLSDRLAIASRQRIAS